jgi:serine protease AprX
VVIAATLVALLAGSSRAQASESWASWGSKFDSDLSAKIVSICSARSACDSTDPATGRPLRERTVQVIVSGSSLLQARTLAQQPVHADLDGAISISVKVDDLQNLATDAGVTSVALDSPVVPTSGPGTPVSFPALSPIYPKIDGAPAAWSNGLTGEGIGVAVIDTGIQDLSDFAGRVVRVRVHGSGGITLLPDTYGHGSFVSGVLGGKSPDGKFVGVAPGATIYAINVEGGDGSAYSSDVIAGLGWVYAHAEENNIRVVNLSLSETNPSNYDTSRLDTVIEQLWQAGIVVVASAGNLGPNTAFFAPGNDPFAVTVGSTDSADTVSTADDTQASWSTYGFTLDGYAKPELLAPGRHIVSTLPSGTVLAGQAPPENTVAPGYVSSNGTSWSAPQVAGAVALILQRNPNLTPDQVKWLLAHTSRVVQGGPGGALDIAAALAYTGTIDTANKNIPPAPRTVVIRLSGRVIFRTRGEVAGTGASWNGASWNAASWNGASWNAASWNAAASWNTAASWNAAAAWFTAASWNAASWNAASWNGASWNGASWNGASWNGASWNGASWNGASWNAASWNAASWNAASWNAASWNAASWNGASWNAASWNAVSWNALSWNAASWN